MPTFTYVMNKLTNTMPYKYHSQSEWDKAQLQTPNLQTESAHSIACPLILKILFIQNLWAAVACLKNQS